MPDRKQFACPWRCAGCPQDQAGSPADAGGPEGLAGWRLAVRVVILFLMPLALAVAGAALAGTGGKQLAGALVGLAVGLAASVIACRIAAGRKKPQD